VVDGLDVEEGGVDGGINKTSSYSHNCSLIALAGCICATRMDCVLPFAFKHLENHNSTCIISCVCVCVYVYVCACVCVCLAFLFFTNLHVCCKCSSFVTLQ
jgi:hypothetical protein